MVSPGLLGLADYFVLTLVLLISAGIGLYFRLSGGRQQTTREYLLADGSMPWLPVSFSLMASFMSAITLLGVSQENYNYGTQFIVINVAYVIGTPVAAYVFLPVFYKLQSPSVYKYLEERFGPSVRLLASLAFSLQMILYMGIVLYAPALALSAVTGLHFTGCVLGVGIVCTFYSTVGGMKAVLVTDVFQSLLMFGAIISVLSAACYDSGGLLEILKVAQQKGRINLLETSIDPTVRHTVWTQAIGGVFVYCSLYAVNQTQVQRLLSVKSLKQAQLALWAQIPILMLLSISTSLSGLAMLHHYRDCDPLSSGRIRSPDQLMPRYIVDRLSVVPGLSGLAVSGIFSGSLSTVSSAINSLAAVTLEDYVRPWIKVEDKMASTVLKGLAVFYGLTCILLAFVADLLGTGVLQASLTIFGVVGGPLLAVFTLAILFPISEQVGAVSGLLAGLTLVGWAGFGGPKPPLVKLPASTANCSMYEDAISVTLVEDDILLKMNATLVEDDNSMKMNETLIVDDSSRYFYLYRISYAWYSLMGFMTTLVVGLAVSWVVKRIRKTRMYTNCPENRQEIDISL